MGLNYDREYIRWNDDEEFDVAPMEVLGALSNKETCDMVYALDTANPILQEGEERQPRTLRPMYTWGGLRKDVINFCKTCDKCQRCKNTSKAKYGLLPEGAGEHTKWARVNVDLWGPKPVVNKNGTRFELHLMAMVDPVTGWFEMGHLYGTPTAQRCQEILDNTWLARYPRPKGIGFGNGGEFKGEFSALCGRMGMKKKPSLSWNPQSNAILERIHQILGDCLRTFGMGGMGIDPGDGDPSQQCLTEAAYAIRCGYHATHGCSPAELVFGRNMFLPVTTPIDLGALRVRKQKAIAKSNKRGNSKRKGYKYQKGDWIIIKEPGILRELTAPWSGPYKVVKHHDNGTLTYGEGPFVGGRVNIRRVKPYGWRDPPKQVRWAE